MKYYITEYCFTDGIYYWEREEGEESYAKYIYFRSREYYEFSTPVGNTFIHKKYCFEKLENAISHCEFLRDKKIKSLEKQISKIKALEFRIKSLDLDSLIQT